MTRDPERRPGTSGPEDHRGTGRLRTTRPGAVIAFALVGLVAGWLLRRVSVSMNQTAPTVGWVPVLALLFLAVVVAAVARSTSRLLHRRHEHLEPHQAVNRLVLGKACALAGSLVGGGYFGYALSWARLTNSVLARQRVLHSVLAGVAAVLLVIASLLLERACRIREDR